MRTTLDIDTPILKELKQLQKREGKTMGRLVSELLAYALRHRNEHDNKSKEFSWISREMGARYDLADHDAILDALDQSSESDKVDR
jgi:hypothetical protein